MSNTKVITVSVSGNSVSDLAENLKATYNELVGGSKTATSNKSTAVSAPAADETPSLTPPAEESAKPQSDRAKRKAEREAKKAAKEAAAKGGKADASSALDEIRALGARVLKAKKNGELKELLEDLGAETLSTLSPELYEDAKEGLLDILGEGGAEGDEGPSLL